LTTYSLIIGNVTQPNSGPLPDKNSKIYMLDVRNYTWVNTFEAPSTTSTSTTTPTTTSIPDVNSTPTSIIAKPSESNNQLTTMKLVVATISSIFGTAILMAIGFFGYKYHKRRQRERTSEIMRVHGNVY
jgi:hypothetical protein